MKELIQKNLYLNSFLRTLLMKKYNKKVWDFSQRAAKIDSIQNYDEFKKFITEFKDVYSNGIFSLKTSYSESLLYGHLNAIFEYAGLDKKDAKYFPILEHGIQFHKQIPQNAYPRAFQGDYLLNEFKKEYGENFPLYIVGSYINYAKPYYDEEKMNCYKKKLGKTLVVFPFHTYELAQIETDENSFVDYVMEHVAKDYDTVLVCAYWCDLQDKMYELFQKKGAKLVSAGFRGDFNFIRRLRAIIELADCVVSNNLGTFLGYSVGLGRPAYLVESEIKNDIQDIEITDKMSATITKIEQEFNREFSVEKERLNPKQKELCDLYWGTETKRTPQELQAILEVNKMIIKKAHGNIGKMAAAAAKLYNSGCLDKLQQAILGEALQRRSSDQGGIK